MTHRSVSALAAAPRRRCAGSTPTAWSPAIWPRSPSAWRGRPEAMRLLVDGSSASGVGGAWTRLRELARELPARAPQHEVAFVVRPRLRAQMEEIVAPNALVLSPPASLGGAAARVGWQLTRLPHRARRFGPDVVFSPFNILAPRWPAPRPRLAVMVSSLAPFSPDLRRSLRIRERPRDALLHRLTRSAMDRADLVMFQSHFGLEAACNGHTP